MNYYTDLFTPQTWDAFQKHGGTVSGFRERQKTSAEKIRPGDLLVCYLVRLSRWCGVLEVLSEAYTDSSPIFMDPDPFVVRFKVAPRVALDLEHSIPIFEAEIWPHLSLTQDLEPRAFGWAQSANLRASLRLLSSADGDLLVRLLTEQSKTPRTYPLSQQDQRRILLKTAIRTADRSVIVDVPDDEPSHDVDPGPGALIELANEEAPAEVRSSIKIQAKIATIGAQMGFRIWVPRSDKLRVLSEVPEKFRNAFLEVLPLNYDDTTLRTIEQIDVIWLKNRSMARAFEIEHTTAVYSGLLRMADLLALQPNMDIRLHIVAPGEKREKVLREIKRPVFSLLDQGPLYESCSFIPYDAVEELAQTKHLGHMSDSILNEYEELAEDI